MIEFFNTWVQGIVIAVIIATIIEMILPKGNNQKYIKIIIGIYIMFTIVSPVIKNISKENFSLDIEKYWKELDLDSIEVGTNLNNSNEKNIEEIYIKNLKKDMEYKLKEHGYIIENIEIYLEKNTNEYSIKQIEITAKKDKIKIGESKNNKKVNEIHINKVNEINISIENKDEEIEKENLRKLNEPEKKAIKTILTSNYGLQEENIIVN